MKLAAIYNVWDGEEMLIPSMNSVRNGVDLFIIVYQKISNYGEQYDPLKNLDLSDFNHILIEYTPIPNNGFANEKAKRNLGIHCAKENNCTHILQMDCDEFYQYFHFAKEEYLQSGCDGSVAKIITYFKTPTLRLKQFDNYYVPFIHKLHPDTQTGSKDYPFYVDPTRGINTTDIFLITDAMHHFSYVRKDIERKARNSSARKNIAKSKLLQDYYDPNIKAGSFLADFHQHLIEVEDIFKLSPIFITPPDAPKQHHSNLSR
jgi:hypothetical protein